LTRRDRSMTIDGVLDGDRDARSGPGDPVHPDYGP
jgi:hypothetical protein